MKRENKVHTCISLTSKIPAQMGTLKYIKKIFAIVGLSDNWDTHYKWPIAFANFEQYIEPNMEKIKACLERK